MWAQQRGQHCRPHQEIHAGLQGTPRTCRRAEAQMDNGGMVVAPSQGLLPLGRCEKPHLCFSTTHGQAPGAGWHHGADQHSLPVSHYGGQKRWALANWKETTYTGVCLMPSWNFACCTSSCPSPLCSSGTPSPHTHTGQLWVVMDSHPGPPDGPQLWRTIQNIGVK